MSYMFSVFGMQQRGAISYMLSVFGLATTLRYFLRVKCVQRVRYFLHVKCVWFGSNAELLVTC